MSFRPISALTTRPQLRIALRIALTIGLLLAVATRSTQRPHAQESVPPRQPLIPIQAGQPLPVALNNQSATLLPDGRVLVAGGSTNGQPSGARREAYLYNPATGLWTQTGSMATARNVHFAVLLQSGKVLVGGGVNATDGVLRSAELYDPVTGAWQTTGALNGARFAATGTLISFASNVPGAPSGFVLAVGGRASTSGGALNTAELYNPATGVWRPTATNLRDGHNLHAAVVLPDGTILVAGGHDLANTANPFVTSAEIYDPVADRWSVVNPMSVGRENPTGTLLPNGQVIITGGLGPNGTLDSTELYNPVNRTWTTGTRLNAARERHTATLLPNGKLLVAGGLAANGALASAETYDPTAQRWDNAFTLTQARGTHAAVLLANARVLFIGGTTLRDESTALSGVDIHDPANGFWQTQSAPSVRRFAHTATLLPNGKVLVAGGRTINNSVTASAELYDPSTGTWRNTGSLNVARECHTMTLLNNGLVLVTGGLAGGTLINIAELYDPGTETWRRVSASMIKPRALHTATLLQDGRVLLAGGQIGASSEQTAEIFNPSNESLTQAASLRSPRNGHTATLLFDGRVLVTGGFPISGTTSQNTAELYTPGSDSWAFTSSSMAVGRYGHTATLLPNGKVLVVAGLRGSNLAQPTVISGSAELFDPGPQSWATTSVPDGRYTHTATLLPNGKVLIAGGAKLNGPTSVVELYDPARGTSLPFEALSNAPLATARDLHTATLLPNGKVLIVGGESGGDFLPASTSEIFDVGLNVVANSAPGVSEGLWSGPGNPVCVSGIRFQGLGEAASGGFQASATNYPVVQLRRLDNEQTLQLLPDLNATACGANRGWTNNGYASRVVAGTTTNGNTGNLPAGMALLTVFVNGIPNTRSVVIAPPGSAVGGTPVVSVTGRIFTVDDAGFPATITLRNPSGQVIGTQQTNTNGEYIFEDVPSPNVGNITGTVRNAANNQTLANATVTSSGISATTASNGAYTLSNVPAGTRTVSVAANGFTSQQATVSVAVGQTVTRDFALSPLPTTGNITGTVVSTANNQAIPNATVRVVSTNQTATTAANGTFTLSNVPAGTQTLTASASGFNSVSGTVTVIAGQTISILATLDPTTTTGAVTGTVRNAQTGQVLAGAVVAISGTNLSTTTNSSGVYTLTNVPAGVRTLTASASGFSSNSVSISVPAGQTLTANLSLSPILPTGQIRVTLNWNKDTVGQPDDLDLHAIGPLSGGGCFEVYWNNVGNLNAAPFAQLEVDNINLSGHPPTETLRLSQTFTGVYHFFLYDYGGEYGDGIARSRATVQVYGDNGLITSFTAPSSAGAYWHVFDLNGQTRAITPVNTLGASPPAFTCGSNCTYSLSPASTTFDNRGGTGSFSVTTQANCTRAPSSNASWLTVTSGSGSGSGTVTYSVATNTSTASRTGVISVGGQSFTVTQTGAFQLVNRLTSAGPLPANCGTPTSRTAFNNTDARVYGWFIGNNMVPGDTFRQELVQPNGSIYFSANYSVDFTGTGCYFIYTDIAGTQAAGLFGTWQLRGYFRNGLIFTNSFTISPVIGLLAHTPPAPSAEPRGGSGQTQMADCCAPAPILPILKETKPPAAPKEASTLSGLFDWQQSEPRAALQQTLLTATQPLLPFPQRVIGDAASANALPINAAEPETVQQQGTYTITPSGLSPRGNTVIFFPPVVPITFDNPGGVPGARAARSVAQTGVVTAPRAPLAGGNGSACAQTTTNNQIGGLLSPLGNASGVTVRLSITNQKAECNLPASVNADLTPSGLGFTYAKSGLALNGNYRIEPMSGSFRFRGPGGNPDHNIEKLDGPQLGLDFTVIPNVICPPPTTATVNGQASVQLCEGATINLSTPAVLGATGYRWTGPNNYSSTDRVPAPFNATTASSGRYTVTVSITDCPALTAFVDVTVNAAPAKPAITPNGPTTFCDGGSVILSAPAASSYLWSNGATTQSITVSTSGNFNVRVTNANGCQSAASDALTVTVNPPPAKPAITPNGPTTFCDGGSVILSAPAASSYLWSNGATTQSITVSASGSFSVRVTNANGCQSAVSDTLIVTVNPPPAKPTITPSGPQAICSGQSLTLTAPPGAASYRWSNGETTRSITVSAAGSYTVQITDANNCQSVTSDPVVVTVNPQVSITTQPVSQAVCAGANVTFSVTAAGTPPFNYQWRKNGVNIGGANNNTYTINAAAPSDAGSYDVQVNSGCGTTNSTVATLTLNAFTLSASSANFTATSGNGFVDLAATVNQCAWNVASNADWLRITSATSGTGSARINYTVDANNGTSSRNGVLTIAGLNFNVTQSGLAPSARIDALSQATALVGTPGLTLTLTGANFTNTARVRWQGSERATNFVSATQLSAVITTADLAAPGTFTIDVFDPPPGGGASNQVSFTVQNPLPQLTNLNPANRDAGSGQFTLTVNGSNFVNGAAVRWNGNSRTTNFVSATQLTAVIADSDIAAQGTATVTVLNPAPGGGASGGLTFTINQAPNPVPVLTSLSPNALAAGGAAFTLTVNGNSFVSGASVRWNGNARTTNFVSATQLTAQIPGTDVASAGTASVTVVNPAPGGGTSGAQAFTITTGAAISSIAPSQVIVGGPGFTLTVNGTNLTNGVRVRVNGNERSTNFISSTRVTAEIPASDIATSALVRISVVLPGGSVSNETMLTVARATAHVSAASFSSTSFAPESIVACFGTNMATGSDSSNKVPLPTVLAGTRMIVRDSANVAREAPLFFVSPGQINYLVPAGTASGTATVTITASDGVISGGQIEITQTAAGLFTANANGSGVPSAFLIRVGAGGAQTFEQIARFDTATNSYVPLPINLGPASDQVFLILYGTGVRNRASLGSVTCSVGGTPVAVGFASAQGDLVGLDQINLDPLPRSLAGRGNVNLILTVEGRAANTVQVSVN